ncbi:hypothetical protein [Frigidibacter oleivorans]|uniref:hypothetical protein n=1 Tax=Frigidibacter oleivorans TaxID=2487129 RepID=UPI001F368CA8|nr:hypothetical protein [Frigidibacter oleivorans]
MGTGRIGMGVVLLALAACGTPQEQCIGRATRDLRVLNDLIEDTRANVARGYAYEEYTVRLSRWETCYTTVKTSDGKLVNRPYMCMEDYVDTRRRPVSIDLAAEQRKLDSMLVKQRELNREAARQIEACKAQYPES